MQVPVKGNGSFALWNRYINQQEFDRKSFHLKKRFLTYIKLNLKQCQCRRLVTYKGCHPPVYCPCRVLHIPLLVLPWAASNGFGCVRCHVIGCNKADCRCCIVCISSVSSSNKLPITLPPLLHGSRYKNSR